MRNLTRPAVSAVLAIIGAAAACHADVIPPEADASGVLDAYVAREQPNYGWSYLGSQPMPAGATLHRLELTSQTWMGVDWKHPLNIVVPADSKAVGDAARPGHCVMVITSGDEDVHAQVCAMLTARLGAPIVILHHVPNQPLLPEHNGGHGLYEDALIAQTFLEFFRTGEADWPLLLPMARSVVSAMDAVGEFSAQAMQEQPDTWKWGTLDKFMTTGASKRGWTTWLSAVVDDRVFAIAPMVYDNLNLPKQIPLHYETWGEPSPSIHDYTERGLLEILADDRGKQLMQIVDPFSYANRLDVPKLLLMGTNDPYWPLAAILEYYAALPGDTYCHYVPNAGHTMGANLGVLSALVGFFDAVTGRVNGLPTVAVTVADGTGTVRIDTADGRPTPDQVNLLAARATTGADFRRSQWTRMEMPKLDETIWRLELPADLRSVATSTAFIAELSLTDHTGSSFLIHAPVQIVPARPSTSVPVDDGDGD